MVYLVFVVIIVIILMYVWLEYIKKCWLVIFFGVLMVVVIVLVMGVFFEFNMLLGMLNFNFVYWWGEDMGW